MAAVVGFDRKIKREWLDALADQVAQGRDSTALRTYLYELLKDEHPGDDARGKTITVLMRVWVLIPEQHHAIREQAFELLKTIPSSERIWLHWGMCLLAYPLFRDVSTAIGRLLKLQDDFTLAQLERRLISTWGERSTVVRAFQRVVRSMVEWKTLADAEARGHFNMAPQLMTKSKPLQLWLLRASHAAERTEMIEATRLLSLPSCFPFKISIVRTDLRHSKDFTIHRQGLDMDMVATVSNNGAPMAKTSKKKPDKAQHPTLFDEQ